MSTPCDIGDKRGQMQDVTGENVCMYEHGCACTVAGTSDQEVMRGRQVLRPSGSPLCSCSEKRPCFCESWKGPSAAS